MEFESAREAMERRYGRLDSGQTALRIAGREYRLDSDDRRFVVFEFDAGFDILSEMRADSLAWEGDDFFFSRIWAG